MGLLRVLSDHGHALTATVAYNSYMPAMIGFGNLRVLTTIEGLAAPAWSTTRID